MKNTKKETRRYSVEEIWASEFGPFYVRDTEVPYGSRNGVVQTFITKAEAQAKADEMNVG